MKKYEDPKKTNNNIVNEVMQQAESENKPALNSFGERNGLKLRENNKQNRHLNVIGKKEIRKARETLQKYKQEKQSLENRIVANEEWWKIHNWEQIKKKDAYNSEGKQNPNGIETPSSLNKSSKNGQ